MNWPFLAVIFSGWLYIDAIYRGPVWQRWFFKPITLILLLLWIWQSPDLSLHGYLIFSGLLLSLIGDALIVFSKERMLPVIGAYFSCHLLYTISFATALNFSVHFPLLLGLIIIAAVVIALIWSGLEEMKWPILIYYGVTLLMVWVASECYLTLGNSASFSVMVGSIFLWIAGSCGLLNSYRFSIKAADGIIASFYFLGHFMVARSLHLLPAVDITVSTV